MAARAKRLSTPKVLAHLRTEPRLGAVIDRLGPQRIAASSEGSHFEALTRAIVFQQLSGAAARTIHGRFLALFKNGQATPKALLRLADDKLQSAGLSRQKTAYLKDLARHADEGLLELDELDVLPDDEVIAELTAVKGVGVWTAQMFLMFRLGRPDVLPILDLGIRKAIQRLFALRKQPDGQKLERLALPWRPYRTVACWYLWRSLEA